MQTWLTVAALSKRIGRPYSTLRLWRDTYDVPGQLDEHGQQTYPLEIFEAIAAMRAQNLTPREITAELERRHGERPGDSPVTREEAILEELRAIRAAVERIAEQLAERES